MLISKNKAHIPYDPRLKDRARELRKNMTAPEKKLWNDYLRDHRLTFLRQKPIAFFIADFYCSHAKLVIEIDGDSHFNEFGKGYDEDRTTVLEEYGLRVLRFTNEDVMSRFDGVVEIIEKEVAGV
jgi:very-short-patch-repair endonuclease